MPTPTSIYKFMHTFTPKEFSTSIFLCETENKPKYISRNKGFNHLKKVDWAYTRDYRNTVNIPQAIFWKNLECQETKDYFVDSLTDEWLHLTKKKVYKLPNKSKTATQVTREEFKKSITDRLRNQWKRTKQPTSTELPEYHFTKTMHDNGMLIHIVYISLQYFMLCH